RGHPRRGDGNRGRRARAFRGAPDGACRARRPDRADHLRRHLPRRATGARGSGAPRRRDPSAIDAGAVRQPYLTRRHAVAVTLALAVLLLVSLAATAALGPVSASISRAFAPGGVDTTDWAIIVQTRIPRVLLAAVVGASLAAAGAGFQGLLANPLADPHVLGISGGAAVAGAAMLVLGVDPISPLVPLAAFLGALATATGVVLVARTGGRTTPHALLLTGVVVNALAASLIMLVN